MVYTPLEWSDISREVCLILYISHTEARPGSVKVQQTFTAICSVALKETKSLPGTNNNLENIIVR